MKPLISVIVPAYNAETYLNNCIRSIENQTYDNIEIIIINDGSTDGTGNIIEALSSEYDNIQSISTDDLGVSVSRNTGLAMAKGDFVTFVDSDDAIRPETLNILYNAIEEASADIAGCSFSRFSYDGSTLFLAEKERLWSVELSKIFNIGSTRVYSPNEYLNEEIFAKNNSRCWSKLYRKSSLAEQLFVENIVIGEDLIFILELLTHIKSIVEVDYPGYVYYQNTSGAMLRPFAASYMDNIYSWERARTLASSLDENTHITSTKKLLVAIMLVAGKLAELSASARRINAEYIHIAHERLKNELESSEGKDAFKLLDKGYKIKCRLFLHLPRFYMFLYHFHKYK